MKKPNMLDDKEFIAALKAQATPIDFEKLESEGLLQKKGAWYLVSNIHTLPEHVGLQIDGAKIDKKGNTLIKLPKSWKKSQQMYKNFTGKEYNE